MTIEEILIQILDVSAPVIAERTDLDRYVYLEKTGGYIENHINHATIALQSYGASTLDAMRLNEEVKDAMYAALADNRISDVSLNGDYNYNDMATKKHRYQAVFEVVFFND